MRNIALLVASILLSGATLAASSEVLTAKKTDRYHASLAVLPFENDYPTKETATILFLIMCLILNFIYINNNNTKV